MAKSGPGRQGGKSTGKGGGPRRSPAAPRLRAQAPRAAPKVDPRPGAAAKAAPKTPIKPRRKAPAKRLRSAGPAVPSWRGRITRLAVLAAIWGVILVGGVGAYLYLTLPDLEAATRLKRGPTAALLAADGAFIASYGELHGQMITVAELPPHLPRAVIAIEDRRFYEHGGVDLWGVGRAIVVNVASGSLRQGASTITQQLARNLLLSQERSFVRKAREALLALELERRFGKDQILTLYLNRVYFGGGAYGVDAAARRFFGKPATEVNLWEAALLAGVLQAPSRLAPDRNPEDAAARARLVLKAMVEAGFVSPEAANEPMAVVASAATALGAPVGGNARYFADWALDQADGFMAGLDRDVLVQTTLDLTLQQKAERAVADALAAMPKGAKHWPSQAALIAMTPDGAVRAMVGGMDYQASQFNRATQARRQMGSAFKTFVYLAAMEAGKEPDDMVLDAPIEVGKWRPRNYKDRYYGEVTLREALARSLNGAAVRLAEEVGRERAITVARRLGVVSPLPDGPSVTLGAGAATLLEMTGAYAALAAGGRYTPPYGVVEVRARDGAMLYQPSKSGAPAVAPEIEERMNNMLAAVGAWGSGKAAAIDRDAAGKTGTSQNGRDAWFIGYTADLVVGVWVGHDDDRPIPGLTGGGLPARIWHDFMAAATGSFAPKTLPGVAGLTPRAISDAVETSGGAAWIQPAPKPFVVYEYPEGSGD